MSTAGLRADPAAQAPGCHISRQRHTTTVVVAVAFKGTFKDHITFLNPRLPGPTWHALGPCNILRRCAFLIRSLLEKAEGVSWSESWQMGDGTNI